MVKHSENMSVKVLKRLVFISLIVVCGLKQTAAQAPWAAVGGADFFDGATDLISTPDNELLITINGSDTSVFGFTIVKFDTFGNKIWYSEDDYSIYPEAASNMNLNLDASSVFITGYVDLDQHLRVLEFDVATGNLLNNSDSWSDFTAPFTGLSARTFTDNSDSLQVFAASGNTLYRYKMNSVNDLASTQTYAFPDATLNEKYAITASADFGNEIQIISGTTQFSLRPYVWAFSDVGSIFYDQLTSDSIYINGLNAQPDNYFQLSGNTFDSTNLFFAIYDTIGGVFNLVIDTIYPDPGYKIIGGEMVRLTDGTYVLNAIKNPGSALAKTVRYYIDAFGNIFGELSLLDDETGVELPLLISNTAGDKLFSAGTLLTPAIFDYEYALTSGPIFSELPACALDCVWPGDADNNGVVDMTDIFPLGISYAAAGTPRDSISNNWIGNSAIAWPSEIYAGLNAKYADCFGDGAIDETDVVAIYDNYTLEHVVNNYRLGDEGFPLWLNTAGITLVPGYNEIPIMLGTEFIPVDAIIGLEFNIGYEGPPIIDSTSLQITFNDSWFGEDTSIISMYYNFPLSHQIDAGAVNIEYENKSGFGEIGRMGFIVEDNIAGILIEYGDSSMIFNVSSATGIKYDYSPVELSVSSYEVLVGINNIKYPAFADNIYPNPANNSITITLPEQQSSTTIKIYDLSGKLIAVYNAPNSAVFNINIEQLVSGMYILRAINNQTNNIIGISNFIIY